MVYGLGFGVCVIDLLSLSKWSEKNTEVAKNAKKLSLSHIILIVSQPETPEKPENLFQPVQISGIEESMFIF